MRRIASSGSCPSSGDFVLLSCSAAAAAQAGFYTQNMRQLQLPREPELFVVSRSQTVSPQKRSGSARLNYSCVASTIIILVYVYSGCVYAAMASADDAVLRIRNTEEAKTLLAELQHQEVSKHNIVARYYYDGTSWWSLIRTLAAR